MQRTKEWAIDDRSVVIRIIGGFLTVVGATISIPNLGDHLTTAALTTATATGLMINEMTAKGTRNTTVVISLSSDDPQFLQVPSNLDWVDLHSYNSATYGMMHSRKFRGPLKVGRPHVGCNLQAQARSWTG
jgi:hypothetical protein